MDYAFARTCIGYSHKANHKPCQDFTLAFHSPSHMIIACCDGHGGDSYIRSKLGSELACKAVLNVFSKMERPAYKRLGDSRYLDQIKLEVLCEWNKLVAKDLREHPIRKAELVGLSESDILKLKANPVRAYGTTLTGGMNFYDKYVVIGIGDSEAMFVSKGKLIPAFKEDEDEPVANITYSMCQEDAYAHMRISVIDHKDVDGLILCTDGLTSPYQSYANFNENFVKPMMKAVIVDGNIKFVDKFIEDLASRLGVGDDVSLACILNANSFKKYYI